MLTKTNRYYTAMDKMSIDMSKEKLIDFYLVS